MKYEVGDYFKTDYGKDTLVCKITHIGNTFYRYKIILSYNNKDYSTRGDQYLIEGSWMWFESTKLSIDEVRMEML